MRPQLEYASSVWSPNTTQDIDKFESAQRRSARWATRDYQQTSSVTEMLEKLRWRPLDQSRINNRLIMLYKITYDIVAIPIAEYLVPNGRESKFIHPLAYRQSRTSTNYYKFRLFPRTIVRTLECTPHQHRYASHTGTVQSCSLPGGACVPLIARLYFIF